MSILSFAHDCRAVVDKMGSRAEPLEELIRLCARRPARFGLNLDSVESAEAEQAPQARSQDRRAKAPSRPESSFDERAAPRCFGRKPLENSLGWARRRGLGGAEGIRTPDLRGTAP
jgi:hypothetical protein